MRIGVRAESASGEKWKWEAPMIVTTNELRILEVEIRILAFSF